jgi:hypothetical protein
VTLRPLVWGSRGPSGVLGAFGVFGASSHTPSSPAAAVQLALPPTSTFLDTPTPFACPANPAYQHQPIVHTKLHPPAAACYDVQPPSHNRARQPEQRPRDSLDHPSHCATDIQTPIVHTPCCLSCYSPSRDTHLPSLPSRPSWIRLCDNDEGYSQSRKAARSLLANS